MESEVEELAGRGGGGVGDLLGGDATEGGDVVCDNGDVGTLVALAAMGDGRQVGGIGFEQDAVERHGTRHVGEGGVLVCDDSADADVEAHLNGAVCFLYTTAEAVHDTAVLWAVEVAQKAEEFVVRLTDMQAYGQPQLFGPEYLLP